MRDVASSDSVAAGISFLATGRIDQPVLAASGALDLLALACFIDTCVALFGVFIHVNFVALIRISSAKHD